jgi:putative DNA primase/helicase
MNVTSAPAWVVFEKRGLTQKGDYWLSLCPSHNDDKQSLGIKIGEGGKMLIHCYAGCSVAQVCEALKVDLKFLWPPSDKAYKPTEQSRVVAEYDYTDEAGKLLYQVQRTDPKGFRQRRKTETGWEWKLGDVRRVLYRLPELLKQKSRPVIIVEGEKDVDNLRKIGLLATTCAGGADGWRPEYSQSLVDRHCIVIPDNDPPGEEFAAVVCTWIPNVMPMRLPGVPLKGDVSDWIAMGNGAKQLGELARACALQRITNATRMYVALGGK